MNTNLPAPDETEVSRLQDRFLEPRTFPACWDVSELLTPSRPSGNSIDNGPAGASGLPSPQPFEAALEWQELAARLPGWKFPELKTFPVITELPAG